MPKRLQRQAHRLAKHLYDSKRDQLIELGKYTEDTLPNWDQLADLHESCSEDRCGCREKRIQEASKIIFFIRHDDLREVSQTDESDPWS